MNFDPKGQFTGDRTDTEPAADRTPVSLFLVVLFALLVYWGMIYLDDHGGSFDAKVYVPYASAAELESLQPVGGVNLYKKGARLFNQYCSNCHQGTGMGIPGQYPPLAGSDWVAAKSPERVIRIVLNGLSGPITVKGLNFNNSMSTWKAMLTDEDVAAVLTFVRQDKEWGNSAPGVTPEQVRALRAALESRGTDPFTPDELLKIPIEQ